MKIIVKCCPKNGKRNFIHSLTGLYCTGFTSAAASHRSPLGFRAPVRYSTVWISGPVRMSWETTDQQSGRTKTHWWFLCVLLFRTWQLCVFMKIYAKGLRARKARMEREWARWIAFGGYVSLTHTEPQLGHASTCLMGDQCTGNCLLKPSCVFHPICRVQWVELRCIIW